MRGIVTFAYLVYMYKTTNISSEWVLNMRKVSVKLPVIASMIGLLGMTACSTGMEANRPVPVDLSQFHAGDSRFNVVSVVGAPEGSMNDTAGPCDIYSLYTTGLGGFGKGVITGAKF